MSPEGEYTFGIEGPAVDRDGNLYVVNFQRQGTIGKIPAGASQSNLFLELPPGSIANAVRFDAKGWMYIADYKLHNVFVLKPGDREPSVYFSSSQFNQPNDLTVAPDGTLYASDPNWKRRDGQIWRIGRDADGNATGDIMKSDRKPGATNGIDLSPDGQTLYVGDSVANEIWAYRVQGAHLTAPRLVKKYSDFSIDGLRTDIDGRIFIARILKGTIEIIEPDGRLVQEIKLQGKEPTNLAFGGLDGKAVYVTQRKGGYIETFRVSRPGREFCLQNSTVECR